MATRNPLVRVLASATSRIWFPMVLFTARSVPRPLMHLGGRGLARVYYGCRQKYLRAARANLAVIVGATEDSPDVRRLAFEMVSSHFSAWVDFLRFATRSREESALLVESVTGYSRIVEARLGGKGVLLQVDQPIHVVLVPDIFPGVERERRRLHARCGVTEIPVDQTIAPTLAVLRALSENEIVAMQGDRDFDNTGVAMPFFGRSAFFPRGPLRVAMASGATVLPAFIVRGSGGGYRAIVTPRFGRTSAATSRSSSATSASTRSSGTASTRSGTTRAGKRWRPLLRRLPRADRGYAGLRALTAATKNAS